MNAADEPDLAWLDGSEAQCVSLRDRGLHYGDGVFETISCVAGEPRYLERHLARLRCGCARLGLPVGPDAMLGEEVRRAASGRARSIIKLIVTRGPARSRGYATSGTETGSRILLRYPWVQSPGEWSTAGVRVRIAQLRLAETPALAGIKHLNRLEQVMARREWTDPLTFESILLSSCGHLASGTMSNLFLVTGGALVTPAVDRCGVAGVMRAVVLDAARAVGLAVRVERPGLAELAVAEEIFLTNVRIGIVPVRETPQRSLVPGGVTRRLQEAVRDAR